MCGTVHGCRSEGKESGVYIGVMCTQVAKKCGREEREGRKRVEDTRRSAKENTWP